MSVINSDSVRAGASGVVSGYTIEQSCRSNYDDSAYLSRTPRVAGNRRTWTYSVWFKRGNTTSVQNLFNAGASEDIAINAADQLIMNMGTCNYISTQLFRDPSAWFHLIVAVDTTQSTAASRVRFYGNGTEITAFGTETNPAQNEELAVNSATLHTVGANEGGTEEWDGYMADVHFIDGQQLAASDFGESDANGNWIPKEYSAGIVGSAATATFAGGTTDATDGSAGTYTFSNHAIGTDTGTRKVLVAVSLDGKQGDEQITGVTIDGDTATQVINSDGASAGRPTDMWIADVLSGGTTGDIVITFTSGGLGTYGVGIGVWALEGVSSSPYDVIVNNSTNPGTGTIDCPAGGVIIASEMKANASGSPTTVWTGLTERYDAEVDSGRMSVSGASDAFSAKQTGLTVTATRTATGDSQWAFNVVSFGPVDETYGTNGFHLDYADSSHFGYDIQTNLRSSTEQDFLQDITDASLTTDLKLCLDAGDSASYTSGTSWLDQSGGGYDFFFGADAGASTDDPTFNGAAGGLSLSEYMSFDGGDLFKYDTTTEGWMDNLHQDNALFTIAAWVWIPASAAEQYYVSTTGSGFFTGIYFYSNGTENPVFAARHGSGNALTVTADTALTTGAWNFIAISIDEATGAGGGFFYVNGDYSQVSSADTFTATYSTPSSSAAASPMILGARTGGGFLQSTAKMAGMMIWEGGTAITKANLDTLYASTKERFEEFEDSGLATNDQVTDSPTDDADNGVGNYCTLNPLDFAGGITLSNGNLQVVLGNDDGIRGTQFFDANDADGYYWEVIPSAVSTSNTRCGVATADADISTDSPLTGLYVYIHNGDKIAAAAQTTYGDAWTTSEVIGVFLKAGTLEMFNQGISQGNLATGITGLVAPVLQDRNTGSTLAINFGQQPFVRTPPTGAKRLYTASMAAPDVPDPSKYYQEENFTGTGAELARTLTDGGGAAFSPDLVICRETETSSMDHNMIDTTRGATKEFAFGEDEAASTVAQGLKSFDSSGVTLGTAVDYNRLSTLCSLNAWVEGTLPGFEIITWTGTAAEKTITHNLGVAPACIWARNVTDSVNTTMYHQSLNGGTTPENFRLELGATGEADDDTVWFDYAPTSANFKVGASNLTNGDGDTIIAYVFAEVPGFSSFGSYVGNGNPVGPFVFTNYRPRFVLTKRRDGSAHQPVITPSEWSGHSGGGNTTSGSDLVDGQLLDTAREMDYLANGFKIRDADNTINGSGFNMVYCSFAHWPFGGDGVSQARAR